MTNREQKLHEELLKCRANIQRTKKLIAFHRDVLRRQERKADEISAKLNAEKMKSLYTALNASGVDIDTLRQAVENGEIADKTLHFADAKSSMSKRSSAKIEDDGRIAPKASEEE